MDWEFDAEVFQWRGPAPYFFVATPPDVDDFLHAHLGELTYGWGVIPARVGIGDTEVTTSLIRPALFPRATANCPQHTACPVQTRSLAPRRELGYPTPRLSQVTSPVSPPPR